MIQRAKCVFVACAFLGLSMMTAGIPAHAGPRLDTVLEKKVLRVGTPGDYRPFSMKEGTGYAGFDIDMIERIAKELNVAVEYVPTTWPKLMEDFVADKYDVAVGGITRNVTRMGKSEFLPGYAPFGKVALVRAADKAKFTSLESMNQPGVRVIKNPGGTNEKFALEFLSKATISTHEKNAEIPGLIAEGKGDVMITETYEALLYAKKDPRLFAAFIDKPLTKVNTQGFMVQKDDADFVRVLQFTWSLLEMRGDLAACQEKWLQ